MANAFFYGGWISPALLSSGQTSGKTAWWKCGRTPDRYCPTLPPRGWCQSSTQTASGCGWSKGNTPAEQFEPYIEKPETIRKSRLNWITLLHLKLFYVPVTHRREIILNPSGKHLESKALLVRSEQVRFSKCWDKVSIFTGQSSSV